MGEVYLAEDTKLDRKVALKILPADMADSPERLTRFEREAKAIAAINHPNIVHIYSVEEAQSTHFITMELVRGKTLSGVTPKNGLAIDTFLDIAIPLADAVSSAYDQGITHRDLKPANVMVSDEGRVKVLDFGLAKLKREFGESVSGSEGPTQQMTEEGRILGTVAYMSPEQAEGKAIDHRSDIFSLGIILYELSTGKPPFRGESKTSTLSSILKDEPVPITELNPELPRELGKIIKRCLVKDTERRYQTAKDLRNELEELKQELDSGEVLDARPTLRERGAWKKQSTLAWTAAAIVVLAVGGYLILNQDRAPQESSRSETNITKVTFRSGLEDEPSLSPDGKFVAYTTDERGKLDIAVLPLSGGQPIWVADNDADDAQPSWSPDGSRLAFVSAREREGRISIQLSMAPLTPYLNAKGGDIFLVPALGGCRGRARGGRIFSGLVTGWEAHCFSIPEGWLFRHLDRLQRWR